MAKKKKENDYYDDEILEEILIKTVSDNYNFMREKPSKKKKPFNPCKMKCVKCEDIIWSKYPGEFVSCKCGECYVDQTRYYARYSGVMVLFEQGSETDE